MIDVFADQFEEHVTLDELDIDSLMFTEIVSEVHEVFHILISQNRLQNLQIVASLCKYLDTHESRQGSRKELNIPQPQATSVAISLSLSLSHTLLSHSTANQYIKLDHKIEQISSVIESFNIQEYDQHQNLMSRLTSLLSSHLDCSASDFERSTNLADRDLDSLLYMKLMSDVEKMFDVSIDLSVLADDDNFDHLVDILVSAVASLEHTGTTDSSTIASTLIRSSDLITSVIVSDDSIDETHVLTRTTKASSSSSFTIDVLTDAAREFESIKNDFDKLADEYEFSDFYDRVYDKQTHLILVHVVEIFSNLDIDLSSLESDDQILRINVISKHGRMLDVLHGILRHDKLIDYDDRGYIRSDVPVETIHFNVLFRDIVTQFPQHVKEHMLLSLCEADMFKFLSGKMNLLSVLFASKTNRNILEDVYITALMFVIMSQLLTSFLEKALSTSVPELDDKFHIVELKAGTDAMTR